ncbi:MAG: hypothetical protein WC729_26125 [Sphingomonas sp.]|jgi:hypothetical protein
MIDDERHACLRRDEWHKSRSSGGNTRHITHLYSGAVAIIIIGGILNT